ncbi:dynein axonemal assembly factor 3 homolog [Culicoides brevitarsis]|uniref:dynein axonemal assembly factor 3 homolog n=1 Tax=Culicoides brevitarsis TaxID=469753 RepID=UPI00307CACFA
MFWGFCEAIDLIDEYHKHVDPSKSSFDILLYGGGDPRFILSIIAKSYKRNVSVNIYLVEGCIELVARYMLLLSIALEPPEELSIKAKTHLYMDLFGNALLRPASHQYMCSKALVLRKILTEPEFGEQFAPIFNFEHLKYKERDQLENAFEFWTNKPSYVFDIRKYWNNRVRHELASRYDTRSGAFDWDLQMRLKEYGGKTITSQEYNSFRDNGIAFTFPEFEQTHPNKTFAVALQKNGNTFFHRGCVGDITVGPFIPYGVTCSDEKFLKQDHGVGKFRATDITERNLYELMWEIQERREYEHDPKDTHAYGSAKLADVPILEAQKSQETLNLKPFDKPMLEAGGVKVHFMSIDDVLQLHEKPKFHQKFDLMFVAANYFTFLKECHQKQLAPKAMMIFETRRYSTMTKKEIADFLAQIKNYAKSLNLEAVTNFAINTQYSMIKYKLKE